MKQKELSNSYLSSFCMELTMLLSAGFTPYESFSALYEDESDKNGKLLLNSIIEELENGAPVSGALRYSWHFPKYMSDMVETGEKTGRLTESLKALSDYYDRLDRLSLAIKNAVLYPFILFIMMSAVVLILIIRVLPIFNDVFLRLGSGMPPFAVRLMSFGSKLAGISGTAAITAGTLIVIGLIVRIIPASNTIIKKIFKNFTGRRGIFRKIASSRFAFVMAGALAAGFDPENAAELAASVSGGAVAVDKRNKECIELIKNGNSLSDAMFNSGIISSKNRRILSAGSRSGMTDTAMAEIASRCQRDTQDELERIVGNIEPVLVILTSLIVGVILLSVMLPLMSIMSSIG